MTPPCSICSDKSPNLYEQNARISDRPGKHNVYIYEEGHLTADDGTWVEDGSVM